MDSFSFFNTPNSQRDKVLETFTDFQLNGRYINVEVSEKLLEEVAEVEENAKKIVVVANALIAESLITVMVVLIKGRKKKKSKRRKTLWFRKKKQALKKCLCLLFDQDSTFSLLLLCLCATVYT